MSWGCQNKGQPTRGFRQRNSFTGLEAEVPIQSVDRAMLAPKALAEDPSLLFQLLVVIANTGL